VLGNTEHLAEPSGRPAPRGSEQLRQDWDRLLLVREEVFRHLEAARRDEAIGSALQAKVRISAPAETYNLLERYRETLRYLFIVSQVELHPVSGSGNGHGLNVEVLPAEGKKCERCWNFSTEVGRDPALPTVCERCSAALNGFFATGEGEN